MNDLTPQQIVAWYRAQAKKFNEMADYTEQTFMPTTAMRDGHIAFNSISGEELENAVREKSGRIKDLADRLGTSEEEIENHLEPKSRVYIAGRGWLKIREWIA